MISSKTSFIALIGNPVSHSLSPIMQNAALQYLGLDLIYNPAPTHLLKFSANKGCMTIDGLQMLIAQGLKSLSFWTNGLEVPFDIMNDALKNYL